MVTNEHQIQLSNELQIQLSNELQIQLSNELQIYILVARYPFLHFPQNTFLG
jgi:hypothetical protein